MIKHQLGEIYIDPEGGKHRCVVGVESCGVCSVRSYCKSRPAWGLPGVVRFLCMPYERDDNETIHYERVEK